jgi:GTP-binding protein
MNAALHSAKFLMAETAHDRLPISEAEVSFVGRSNVGKSSLICAVTQNNKLARVSKTPGMTRAINVFETKPGRWVVDLPGYGYAVGPVKERNYWPEMIGRYLSERAAMKRVYVLIDAEVGATKLDVSLVQWLNEKNVPYKIVATKTDKFGRDKHGKHRNDIATALGGSPSDIFWVSSREGHGIADLQRDVARELGLL